MSFDLILSLSSIVSISSTYLSNRDRVSWAPSTTLSWTKSALRSEKSSTIFIPSFGSEPLVDYSDLSLVDYPNIHFVGDALSARGITVSGAQGTYVAEAILDN